MNSRPIDPSDPAYEVAKRGHAHAAELRAKGLENLSDEDAFFVILDEEMTKEINRQILEEITKVADKLRLNTKRGKAGPIILLGDSNE